MTHDDLPRQAWDKHKAQLKQKTFRIDDIAPLYDGSYQSSSQLDPSNPATFVLIDKLIAGAKKTF